MTTYVPKEKHKLFLSYYHNDDEWYRRSFTDQFRSYYLSKSVELGDIATDNGAEYIKRLIRENYVADASVVVVLVGPKTKCRKHVDWEISAGLEPHSGRSGLLGILLPEFPLDKNTYNPDDLPFRSLENVNSGYAILRTWSYIDGNLSGLISAVNEAFDKRLHDELAKNGMPQMRHNTCS
ncbi:MAG: TIR domain-containing protein [Pseudonocardiaceae bacterium]